VIKAIAALGAAVVALPLLVILLVTASPAPPAAQAASPTGLAGAPTALARADIPPDYLIWYMDAAQTCPGLPWSVLAGIGTVESDNGKSGLPGVRSGTNAFGAAGPMQIGVGGAAGNTWGGPPVHPASENFGGVAADGDGDGHDDVYDPADAIYAAAKFLCAKGARGGSPTCIEQAVFAYNHASWYVAEVMSWAGRYATQGASKTVATAIAYAKAQLGKPYVWGDAGPDAFDCSGLVYAAYAAAGIHIARTTYQWQQDGPVVPLSQIQPGDLLFSAGSDGTPANPGHVVMYLGGGQVIQAKETGEPVQTGPADLASVVVATRPADLARQEQP
jgi:peptidoglycan DL-endopeptidase CwlO